MATLDTIPPELISFDIPENVALTSESDSNWNIKTNLINISAVGQDDESGIDYIIVNFDKEFSTNYNSDSVYLYSDDSVNFSRETSVSSWNRDGVYTVTRISIWDNAGNYKFYSGDALESFESNLSVTVTGSSTDLELPELSFFEVTPTGEIDLSDEPKVISFTTEVLDQISGADDYVYVYFDRSLTYRSSTSSGGYSDYNFVLAYSNDERSIEISRINEPATYTITKVIVNDVSGNANTYLTDDLLAMGFDTQFELIGSIWDTEAPSLESFSILQDVDVSGDSPAFVYNLSVSDDISGIWSIYVHFQKQMYAVDGYNGFSSTYKGEGTLEFQSDLSKEVYDYTELGYNYIERISLYDHQGNSRDYWSDDLIALGFDIDFLVIDSSLFELDVQYAETGTELVFTINLPSGLVVSESLSFDMVVEAAGLSYDDSSVSLDGGGSSVAYQQASSFPNRHELTVSVFSSSISDGNMFTIVFDKFNSEGEGFSYLVDNVRLDENTINSSIGKGVLSAADNHLPQGFIGIEGEVSEGGTLSVDTSSLVDPNGIGVLNYQWYADGLLIDDEINNTLTLSQAYVGKSMSVSISYTDDDGTVEGPITSTATSKVKNVNDAATGDVLVSGKTVEGELLTASNSILDLDGVGVIEYDWYSSDGSQWNWLSSGGTLRLSEGEVGKTVKVIASFSDDHGSNESIESAVTNAVEAATTSEEVSVAITHWRSSEGINGVSVDPHGQSDSNGELAVMIGEDSVIDVSLPVSLNMEKSINLQDAILILKQIVGLETFNDYQTVAADFDQSSDVGLNDAIGILKHVVGLPSEDPEWVFMESGVSVPLSNGSMEITADMTSVELVGVLTGDVDGSWGTA